MDSQQQSTQVMNEMKNENEKIILQKIEMIFQDPSKSNSPKPNDEMATTAQEIKTQKIEKCCDIVSESIQPKDKMETFAYRITSTDLYNVFDVDDGKVVVVDDSAELKDEEDTNYWRVECYTSNEGCQAWQYNLHWRINKEGSDYPEKMDKNKKFVKLCEDWQVIKRVNTSSPIAMMTSSWDVESDGETSEDEVEEEVKEDDGCPCGKTKENKYCGYCGGCGEEAEAEVELDEDEKEEAEGWNAVYGVDYKKSKTFIMAGGGDHWWNYVVEFDDNDDEKQTAVYIQSKTGLHQQRGKILIYRRRDDGVEKLRLADEKWQPADDCEDMPIVYWTGGAKTN